MTERFDVGIIGAGVHGASAAFHLSSRGAHVVVIDALGVAGGPTGRSSAVCRAYYTDPFLAECARESIEMLRGLRKIAGVDAGFRTTGLHYLHGAEDVEAVRRNAARLTEAGIRVDVLEGDDLRLALPGFGLDDVGIAAHEPRAGYADPHMVTEGLVRRAAELGAETLFGRRVVSVVAGGDAAQLRLDDGEALACQRVLIAAGPWTRALALQVGADLPLTVERHVVATFLWGEADPLPGGLGDVPGGYYLRPEGEDLFLVGPLTPEAIVDPDDFDPEIRPHEVDRLASAITRRVPRLADAAFHGGWASLYDVSPDWMPVIGEIAPGVFVDAGTSGHGFKLAPSLGAHVADLVIGDAVDPRLRAFAPQRFDAGAALTAGYGDARILG